MSGSPQRPPRGSLRSDLRLAWLLTRGSDRREWWRVTLTAVGAGLATGFALAAAALASLSGYHAVPYADGLLDEPGTRDGVVFALLLLLVPVLGFLGQCARIGAVHRDRRLAALRLAGAAPWQVRRIAALESGLACLLGSAVSTVFSVLFLLRLGRVPAVAWLGIALVAVAVPVLGAAVSAVSLRRVVASPLGWVRRVRPETDKGMRALLLASVLLTGVAALLVAVGTRGRFAGLPLVVFALVVLTGMGAVWAAGASARLTGRLLAARTRSAAVLIAAERLRDDPWAAARSHAAALLVAIVGTGFVGVREVLLDALAANGHYSPDGLAFYTTGIDLTAAAILVALAITLGGLAVGAAESLATRRRGLAAQAAAGVPREVLGKALLLETALPLAPAMVIAGIGGMAVSTWYAVLAGGGRSIPLLPLLTPFAIYAACLLTAATSLPLLRRTVRPAELRYV
ncbi:FtsX-like permease family protein [Streptomyces poonensis]|uniref:ABC3 transporter permease C-terminal domain-containing protein n=1 Tax=Streptomyces poonensis TaxID=68255 RepID=A0A918PQJ0_9ACTN|nr:FtsX-like permease family protein [Streptomyces poonensis]GGZ18067.1 hypothetical protein GCM10010365_42730 [Streptomyces poonensis]GLJ91053.1 hypothetical protein GCM10017589_36590 [Streptomyces poonensis]